MRRNENLVQFVHHGRFTHAGITGYEHEFRAAVAHNPIKGRHQSVDFALPAVQFLWDQQSIRDVVRAQRESVDVGPRFPFRQAPPQIGLKAHSSLVTMLYCLSQKSHDDRRERRGDLFIKRRRLPCNVAVDPFHGVGGRERQMAREHLVQDDAQRVEIAAGIDRAIHAAGLFGRHVSESAGNDLRWHWRLAPVGHLRRNPKAGEPYIVSVVNEHIRRLDVLMYELVPMDLPECSRQTNGDAQEARQIQRLPLVPLKNPIQWLSAGILEYKDRPSFVTSELQRFRCPLRIEIGCDRVFVLQPPKGLNRRLFCGECHYQDWRRVALSPAAVNGEVHVLPEGLQRVTSQHRIRRCFHGGHPRRHYCTTRNTHSDKRLRQESKRIVTSFALTYCSIAALNDNGDHQ
jgi:hypothetical protein